jgi:hypothetical protein
MPDPELLKPSDHEFYHRVPMPDRGWPDRENPRALRQSLDKAHDNVKQLVRENDKMRGALIGLKRQQRKWLKILLACLGVLATAIGSIFGWLIPYAVHGMAK